MSNVITGNAFIDALLASGIITVEQHVRRIVIEATADNVVVMYLECYGDKRLLKVVPALTGVEIRREEAVEGPEAVA